MQPDEEEPQSEDDPQPCACGATENVEFCENPYESDLNGDHTKHWMCVDCIRESADEL
jgi:hypothetical protein